MQAAERGVVTLAAIEAALRSDELAQVAHVLDGLWADAASAPALVAEVAQDGPARRRLVALKSELTSRGALPSDIALERTLLLGAARATVSRIAALPVSDSVKALFYDDFALCAAPDRRRAPLLAMANYTFKAMCEVVSLVRFPAGQLHWNTSGLPRSMLRDVAPRDLPRVLRFVATKMRGFAPAAFTHVNELRRNRFIWLEEESNRSYHRLARSLVYQPESKGMVTRAWFHDPDLPKTSPHLAWTNRVFEENGGLVVRAGDLPDLGDAFANNASRRDAYERGEYRPQFGLVLWPRAAMIAWSERNPQFGDASWK